MGIGLVSTSNIATRYALGGYLTGSWNKTINVVTSSGTWLDLSTQAGSPLPNYYTGVSCKFAVMNKAYRGGGLPIYNMNTSILGISEMNLLNMLLMFNGSAKLGVVLLDYLGYYPFIDEGDVSLQMMDNTEGITRYTDGAGVQMMAVANACHLGGGPTFVVTYTNQDGVEGRVTPAIPFTPLCATGCLVSSAATIANSTGPFLPLQGSDSGVRKIESVQLSSEDVGLFTLVLVKPVATVFKYDANIVEMDYLRENHIRPAVHCDAYLNMIIMPQTNLSGVRMLGLITTCGLA